MRGRELGRDVVGASIVCVLSWLALAVGAGNVGLQRSVSIGPGTLADVPVALVLVATVAFTTSAVVCARFPSLPAVGLAVAVLAGDLVGAAVIAPIAIGELTPFDAPMVFVALTALGVQPVASVAGGSVASAVRGRRFGG